MKFRALVVDDQPHIVSFLRPILEREKYTVAHAATVFQGEKKLRSGHYHVVILDRNLPDGDGLGLLPLIAETSQETKTIVLSQRGAVEHRIEGLNTGADEYIPKPFSVVEFVARLHAVTRRNIIKNDDVVQFGGVTIYQNKHAVQWQSVRRRLPPLSFKLFLLFLRNKNIALTREQIAVKVWPLDKYPTSASIDVSVRRLRKDLDGFPFKIITEHYVGYRFVDKT